MDRAINQAWEAAYKSAGLPVWAEPYVRRYAGPMTSAKASGGIRGMMKQGKRAYKAAKKALIKSNKKSNGKKKNGRDRKRKRDDKDKDMAKKRRIDGKKVTARGGSSKVKSRKVSKKKTKPSLKKRVMKLEKELNEDLSVKRYRFIDGDYVECNVAKAGFASAKGIDTLNINATINSLDISTGTDVNVLTQANNTQISIRNCWTECVVMNSTDTPAYVTIYAVVPKIDTSVAPSTHMLNVTQDTVTVGGSAIVIADQASYPLVAYPSDMPDFKRMWKTVGSVKGYLRAGDLLKLTATLPDFKWSDDWYDDSTSSYKKNAALQYLVRIEGDLCFDYNNGTSTADHTKTSTLPSFAQIKIRGYFDVEYPGNIPVREMDYVDSLDTIANTPTTVGPNVINIQS